MVTVQSGFRNSDLSITGPTRLPTALGAHCRGTRTHTELKNEEPLLSVERSGANGVPASLLCNDNFCNPTPRAPGTVIQQTRVDLP
jgi:hypothetical protein